MSLQTGVWRGSMFRGLPEKVDTGTVSLQIQKQENKSESLLCEVVHTFRCPGPQASSEVAQSLRQSVSTSVPLIF